MAYDKPASKRFNDLGKRAEKTLQERPLDNLESTELFNEEMHRLIQIYKCTRLSWRCKMMDNDNVPFYAQLESIAMPGEY